MFDRYCAVTGRGSQPAKAILPRFWISSRAELPAAVDSLAQKRRESVDRWSMPVVLDRLLLVFNERKLNDGERFDAVMSGVVGKRLQYAELIG